MDKKRKIDVFLFLTSGVTPLKVIYNLPCFLKTDGTRVSWKVFLRAMRKLAKDKYIKIIPCGYASEAYGPQAAFLLQYGANFLCAHVNHLDPCDFRVTSPKPANIDHEIKLTQIVNVIKYGARQRQYGLVSLYDDKQIRIWHKNRGESLKDKYIADIKAVLKLTSTDSRVFERAYQLEYENGQKGRSYWEPKLRSWHMNIILITRNTERALKMAGYLKDSRLNICIVTLEDFIKIGILNCVIALQNFQKSIFDSKTGEWKEFA